MRKLYLGILLLGLFWASDIMAQESATNYGYAEEKDLVAYWKFNEGKGNIAKDSANGKNDGKIHGATWIDGKLGKGLKFDGVNDYVNCGSGFSLGPDDDFTYEAWVYIDALSQKWKCIIGGGSLNSHTLYTQHFGKPFYYDKKTDAPGYWSFYGTYWTATGWHHLAMTKSGNVHTIYQDGKPTGSGTQLTNYTLTRMYVGDAGGKDRWFRGALNEVKVYNRALTEAEVKNHYEMNTSDNLLAEARPIMSNDRKPWVSEKVTNIEELKRARKKVAYRKRRIIFNNDGNDVLYLNEATEKALLDDRTTPLLDSQVDSIFYGTANSFGFFVHNTKVGEVFDSTANPKDSRNKGGGFSKNKTADFIKQGTDPLQIMVEFCKKNKIEIFWSMRINDTHDGNLGTWYGDTSCMVPST